jgi:hypothetical protein
MKKFTTIKWVIVLLLALPCCFQACIKDTCKNLHTYSYYVPVYKTKETVRANIKSSAPQPIQNPGKISVLGNTIFLNEIDKGIHIIDNTDPSHPRNTAFINIPGNLDIAVKGNILYADLYTDLVAIDISDPLHVVVKKIVDNLFGYRTYSGAFTADNSQVITDWIKKDTTVTENCDGSGLWSPMRVDVLFSSASQNAGSGTKATPVGVGGSMARFTIMNTRLYTVNNSSLSVMNILSPSNPVHVNDINIGWNIETIYPFKDKLFIGSQAGMYIYNVSNPDAPSPAGEFTHIRSCDPVIAEDDVAFVTLSSGSFCQGFNNELEVVTLNNFVNPVLQKVYPLTNPHGLSKDGNLLFVCDGPAGLKVYNAANVSNLQLMKTIGNMEAYDIIAYNKWALLVAKDGLYQYDYTNPDNIRQLSKIELGK